MFYYQNFSSLILVKSDSGMEIPLLQDKKLYEVKYSSCPFPGDHTFLGFFFDCKDEDFANLEDTIIKKRQDFYRSELKRVTSDDFLLKRKEFIGKYQKVKEAGNKEELDKFLSENEESILNYINKASYDIIDNRLAICTNREKDKVTMRFLDTCPDATLAERKEFAEKAIENIIYDEIEYVKQDFDDAKFEFDNIRKKVGELLKEYDEVILVQYIEPVRRIYLSKNEIEVSFNEFNFKSFATCPKRHYIKIIK